MPYERDPPPAFAALKDAFAWSVFDSDPSCLCVVDPAGVILAVNQAWDTFGRENGAAPHVLSPGILGTVWADHMAGEQVKAMAEGALREARRRRPPGLRDAPCHLLTCDSPTERRTLAARFLPLFSATSAESLGVLASYTRLHSAPVVHDPARPLPEDIKSEGGLVTQCSCCRRVKHPVSGDWIELNGVLAKADSMTHGVCALCMDLWYGPELPPDRAPR